MPFLSCGVSLFVWVIINGDVVVVMKMGAYIHGVLYFYGCLLSDNDIIWISFHITKVG